MKNIFKIFGALALTIAVVSCGTSNTRVYRAPDGRVYRQGEIYRTPNGDVYRNGVLIRSGSTVIIVDDRPLPPGQMKKVYGTKSAKVFAPGQQKNDRYYYDEHGKKRKIKHKKNHR
ncbi:hypothetical protein [Cloacibacterium sp. TD35]|uniref:hypothetical protein n=1 Tax=Cloacibacterium sp. TD35 TaxID=2976818 RepID=UPI00237E0F69|nr:hypothetical protein [Cloacibacterium sp. TD35]WDT67491.1 hypothetical protein N7277_09130 [Cloacibacterium sp. TD35]